MRLKTPAAMAILKMMNEKQMGEGFTYDDIAIIIATKQGFVCDLYKPMFGLGPLYYKIYRNQARSMMRNILDPSSINKFWYKSQRNRITYFTKKSI